MPVWLQDPGAWIAIGVSLLFLAAAFFMHRIFLRVLKGDGAALPPDPHSPTEPASVPSRND